MFCLIHNSAIVDKLQGAALQDIEIFASDNLGSFHRRRDTRRLCETAREMLQRKIISISLTRLEIRGCTASNMEKRLAIAVVTTVYPCTLNERCTN